MHANKAISGQLADSAIRGLTEPLLQHQLPTVTQEQRRVHALRILFIVQPGVMGRLRGEGVTISYMHSISSASD